MNIIERIDAMHAEEEALDTILSPIFDRFIKADGINHNGFMLTEFDTDTKGNVKLTGEDYRDQESKSYWIPAEVIESGDLDAWFAQREKDIEAARIEKARADKQREAERLEARLRILRGELSGD